MLSVFWNPKWPVLEVYMEETTWLASLLKLSPNWVLRTIHSKVQMLVQKCSVALQPTGNFSFFLRKTQCCRPQNQGNNALIKLYFLNKSFVL